MDRRTFLAASAGVSAMLAGCLGDSGRPLPEDPSGDWTQHASDARNTGSTAVTVPPRGNPAWDAGEAHVASPLVADGTVFSVAGTATALDATTGDQQWESELPGTAEQTPAVDDEHLFVATDRRLVALARADGSKQWSVSPPRPPRQSVTVSGEESLVTVPLAARQGSAGLLAYDTATGEKQWEERTLAARTVAFADGTAYTTGYKQDGETGVLRALAATDGSRQWETELTHPDTAPVVTAEGVLVTDGGTVAVHDATDGTRRRALGTFGDRIEEVPAVADGTAFVTASDRALHAISITDGTTLWRNDVGVVADTGISVGRDAVVASVRDLPNASLAGIAAFERTDGSHRWGHEIEGFDAVPSTPPVLAEGATFYVSNESSGVVALGDLPPRGE